VKVTGNENVMHILDVVGYVINLYYKLLFVCLTVKESVKSTNIW